MHVRKYFSNPTTSSRNVWQAAATKGCIRLLLQQQQRRWRVQHSREPKQDLEVVLDLVGLAWQMLYSRLNRPHYSRLHEQSHRHLRQNHLRKEHDVSCSHAMQRKLCQERWV